MRQCQKCGAALEDAMMFCTACGTKYEAPASAPTYSTPGAAPYAAPKTVPSYTGATITPPNTPEPPAILAIRKLAASPVLLFAIIAFSAGLIVNIISIANADSWIIDLFRRIIREEMGRSSDARDAIDAMEAVMKIYLMVPLIPTILMAIGMWMTYVSANNTTGGRIQTMGLTIIKVLSILSAVGVALTALFYLLIIFIAFPQANSDLFGVLLFMLLLVAVCVTPILLYQVKIVNTVNTMKQTMITGEPSANVSSFVAVWSIITGVFSALSACFVMSYSGSAAIASLLSAAASILFGMFLFSYKGQMQTLIAPAYATSAYGVPTPPPAGRTPGYGTPYTSGTTSAPTAGTPGGYDVPPRA